ncbi:hypothetical protein [Nocardia sp. NPDC057668]|uniref:hypothetical protein n=1 Tax=Nocardia sp. NPDC057668 TaxID=3346202 RepID=UPI0036734455
MKALSYLGSAAGAVAAIAIIWPAQAGAAPLGAVESSTSEAVFAQPSNNCHPSYDPCVPNTGDVDCADLRGPVRVHGSDVYRLDRDGNGIGCEES